LEKLTPNVLAGAAKTLFKLFPASKMVPVIILPFSVCAFKKEKLKNSKQKQNIVRMFQKLYKAFLKVDLTF
jgi:hypothetical protein